MTIPHDIVIRRMDAPRCPVAYEKVEYDYGYICGRGLPADKASAHALARLDDWLRTPHAVRPAGLYRLTAYRVRDHPRSDASGTERTRLVASVTMRWPAPAD